MSGTIGHAKKRGKARFNVPLWLSSLYGENWPTLTEKAQRIDGQEQSRKNQAAEASGQTTPPLKMKTSGRARSRKESTKEQQQQQRRQNHTTPQAAPCQQPTPPASFRPCYEALPSLLAGGIAITPFRELRLVHLPQADTKEKSAPPSRNFPTKYLRGHLSPTGPAKYLRYCTDTANPVEATPYVPSIAPQVAKIEAHKSLSWLDLAVAVAHRNFDTSPATETRHTTFTSRFQPHPHLGMGNPWSALVLASAPAAASCRKRLRRDDGSAIHLGSTFT